MAFIRGNERETIQRAWPTGWRWPGNMPDNVAPPSFDNDKGAKLTAFDVPLRDPQAVVFGGIVPPNVVVVTDQALGQIVVRQSAAAERVWQAFVRGSVLPDLVYTAFGNRVVVPREVVPQERKAIDPLVKWNKPDDLLAATRTTIVPPERAVFDNFTIRQFSAPNPELSFARTAIVSHERPGSNGRLFDALLRWGIPPNVVAEMPFGNRVVRSREVVPQELRAIDPTIKFRIPENLVYTAYGNAWINGRELSPQETNRIAPLLRWYDPTAVVVQEPPPFGRAFQAPERWAYDFSIIAPYANSVAGQGPVQEPPPFGRIFTRQEFQEPWILNLGGLVTLAVPPAKPLIVGREQRLFENIQAIIRAPIIAGLVYPAFGGRTIVLREQPTRGDLQALLRWGQPADVIAAQIPPFLPLVIGQERKEDIQALLRWGIPPVIEFPQYNAAIVLESRPIDQKGAITRGPQIAQLVYTAFGNRIVVPRELSPREMRALDAILRTPQPAQLVSTAFGNRIIVQRQFSRDEINALQAIFKFPVPPDFVPQFATGMREKRKWRRSG